MLDLKSLIEILTALGPFAWPLVLLILTLIFRKDVSAILTRLRKTKIGENEIELNDAAKDPQNSQTTIVIRPNFSLEIFSKNLTGNSNEKWILLLSFFASAFMIFGFFLDYYTIKSGSVAITAFISNLYFLFLVLSGDPASEFLNERNYGKTIDKMIVFLSKVSLFSLVIFATIGNTKSEIFKNDPFQNYLTSFFFYLHLCPPLIFLILFFINFLFLIFFFKVEKNPDEKKQ